MKDLTIHGKAISIEYSVAWWSMRRSTWYTYWSCQLQLGLEEIFDSHCVWYDVYVSTLMFFDSRSQRISESTLVTFGVAVCGLSNCSRERLAAWNLLKLWEEHGHNILVAVPPVFRRSCDLKANNKKYQETDKTRDAFVVLGRCFWIVSCTTWSIQQRSGRCSNVLRSAVHHSTSLKNRPLIASLSDFVALRFHLLTNKPNLSHIGIVGSKFQASLPPGVCEWNLADRTRGGSDIGHFDCDSWCIVLDKTTNTLESGKSRPRSTHCLHRDAFVHIHGKKTH